jgi:hypothetical protein
LHIASIVSPSDWQAQFPFDYRVETIFANLPNDVSQLREFSDRLRDKLNVVEKYLTSDKIVATVRHTCTQLGLSDLIFQFKIFKKIVFKQK